MISPQFKENLFGELSVPPLYSYDIGNYTIDRDGNLLVEPENADAELLTTLLNEGLIRGGESIEGTDAQLENAESAPDADEEPVAEENTEEAESEEEQPTEAEPEVLDEPEPEEADIPLACLLCADGLFLCPQGGGYANGIQNPGHHR